MPVVRTPLEGLLTFTRDGEWGKGEPAEGLTPALVVRGTDFENVRYGSLDSLPLRYIPIDKVERKRLLPGDVLIEAAGGTKDQPTGRNVLLKNKLFAEAKFPLICASFARFLRPDRTKVTPEFLFWKLQDEYHSRRMFPYHVQHTGVARFQYTQFARSHLLDLPTLEEQRAISAILSALDDKIELNRRMNETLEAQARALFRDWFVDFGPVKAKMAGGTPYLAPDLWSLFPDRLNDDGVPEGWRRGSLDMLSSLNPESWSAKNAPPSIEYVDLANTKWGYIEATVPYEWDHAPSRGRRVLRPGDTIIGTVRPGNGSFAYIAKAGLTGSTGFAVLRPNSQEDRTFVWCAATDQENIARLSHRADGGAYPAVRPDVVLATPLVLPAQAALRQKFEAAAGVLLDRIESNKTENRTLAETRDLLLPKLMSGEIRVGDAEVQLSEAV